MPESVVHTFCRLCEVNCGLEARVDAEGRLAALRPDRSHPIHAGFACHKGLLALEVHRDPDRLNTPERRIAPGVFEAAEWEAAIQDIARRLQAIRERHGPASVALYMGNPSAFNALGAMSSGLFAQTLGIEHLFNAGTQDCSNKFAVSEILYGSAELHPIADLDHTDYALLVGTNPRVSKMSFLSTSDPVGTLRAARARGARIRFVNPLALADLADVGDTLQIRPDGDATLLAAMLCEIEATRGFDEGALRGVQHVDRLRDFVRRFPAENVAEIVGLESDVIRALAREFAETRTASIHVSTGVNMGRQGALAYWLAQMLSLVTGNLDRRGGNILAARAVPAMGPIGDGAMKASRWGAYRPPRGSPPGSLLADMILASRASGPATDAWAAAADADSADDKTDADQIRALVVVAGNPLLSIPGGERLRNALESLDLLVSIDFYRNATGELADWVLPAADWFEREDLNYFVQGVQRVPYVQWTDRVIQPTHARREDWWILSRIQQEMGLPSLLELPGDDPLKALWGGRLAEAGVSLDALRAIPNGVERLPASEPGGFLDRVSGPAGFDCCPDGLLPMLERAEALRIGSQDEPEPRLQLITRRTHHMMNSTLQNLKVLKTRKGARQNPLYMNPSDAAVRALVEGQHVRVHNEHGSLVAELAFDEHLRPGVVAMSHGFGNERTSGMPVAQSHPGVNVNQLSPSGPRSFDPISAMSQLTGIPVEVSAH
jgi:anaerobic selenocysteine-containing dehydrogenase